MSYFRGDHTVVLVARMGRHEGSHPSSFRGGGEREREKGRGGKREGEKG